MAFAPADQLTPEQKSEILERAFQVNENLVQRWPRFSDLQAQVRSAGAEACAARFNDGTGATCNCFRNLPGWTRNTSPKIR